MLKEYQVNIFVRVVKRRMEKELLTAEEILDTYPALTKDDKEHILTKIKES